MKWYHYLSYFLGGAFLANSIPHIVNGIMGHPFQTPFASPPAEGLSSAHVNILWGAFNLLMWYILVCRIGSFDLRRTSHAALLGLGGLIVALALAYHFGRIYGGL